MTDEVIDIGCQGKQGFDTWKKASRAHKNTKRSQNNRNDKRKLDIYRCRTCHEWHVGGSDRY